jgi:hypothetical protein
MQLGNRAARAVALRPKRKSGDHQLETAVLALAANDPIGVHDLHSTRLSLAPGAGSF